MTMTFVSQEPYDNTDMLIDSVIDVDGSTDRHVDA